MATKTSVPEILPTLGSGVLAGLLLAAGDGYFGGGDALLGFFLLITGTALALATRFWSMTGLLRRPRRLDFHFVAGADYAWRQRKVLSEAYAMLKAAPAIGLPAGAALTLIHSPGWPAAGAAAVAFLLLLPLLALLFRSAVQKEWIRPSQTPFFQSFALKRGFWPTGGDRLLLRTTRFLARALALPLPARYRSLLVRKLLYPLRADFGSLLVWVLVVLTVGLACWWSGNPRLIGAFTLISATAALTAYQLGTREADLFALQCPHYTWSDAVSLRVDLFAAAGLGFFFAAFAGIAQFTQASGDAGLSEFFWKFTLAPLLPTLMAPLDNPARDWSDGRRIYMNAGYLFVAAYLLLTPTWVLALAVAALLSFAWNKSRSPMQAQSSKATSFPGI